MPFLFLSFFDTASGQTKIASDYRTFEAPGKGSDIAVNLAQGNAKLDEVVIVGYGQQKKVTVTGAVATVKGAELEKSPTVNLTNSLAGLLPGISAVQAGGEPGYDGRTIPVLKDAFSAMVIHSRCLDDHFSFPDSVEMLYRLPARHFETFDQAAVEAGLRQNAGPAPSGYYTAHKA